MTRHCLRDDRGSVILLELALLGGLLLVPLLGGLQWSLNTSGLQAAGQAAREATRYVAITGDEAGGRNKAQQIVLGSSAIVRDFDPARDVAFVTTGGYVTGTVTVKVPDFVPGLPKLWGGQTSPGNIRVFTAKATFRREQ